MRIRSVLFILLILSLVSVGIFAQSEATGEPAAEEIGVDTAQQLLKEVSVTRFETAGYWDARIPIDQGLISLRRFNGGPDGKEPIPGEEEAGIEAQDDYVLGAKVEFFKRGFNSFAIFPVKPLPIEGITKTISMWVVGRNYNHTLNLMLEDHFGNRAEITVGKLNFSGWKKLTVAIPTNIVQRDYHYNNQMGVKVVGFRIDTDPEEAYGTYYVYFDDMRAVTDLFGEENRDEDDMVDTW